MAALEGIPGLGVNLFAALGCVQKKEKSKDMPTLCFHLLVDGTPRADERARYVTALAFVGPLSDLYDVNTIAVIATL